MLLRQTAHALVSTLRRWIPLDEKGAEVTEVLIVLSVIVAGLLTMLVNLSGTLQTGFTSLTNTIKTNLP
jgi:Flp pilus assembly pilin Flp